MPDLFEGLPPPEKPRATQHPEETISFIFKLREHGFRDTRLARAFELAPRERFAPPRLADLARKDYALPLPCGESMTAPLVMARMFAALEAGPSHRVLEIGAGSGFGAAVLGHCAARVVTVERYRTLADAARARLAGQANVAVRHADGLDDSLSDRLRADAEGGFDRVILNGTVARWPLSIMRLLNPGARAVAVIGAAGAGELALLEADEAGQTRHTSLGPLSMPPLRAGLAQAL